MKFVLEGAVTSMFGRDFRAACNKSFGHYLFEVAFVPTTNPAIVVSAVTMELEKAM